MAHHASALKAIRQHERRRERNRRNLSQVKTAIKKLRTAIDAGDAASARSLLSETVSQIDVAAKKGVLHENAAARHKSRLSRKVASLATAS